MDMMNYEQECPFFYLVDDIKLSISYMVRFRCEIDFLNLYSSCKYMNILLESDIDESELREISNEAFSYVAGYKKNIKYIDWLDSAYSISYLSLNGLVEGALIYMWEELLDKVIIKFEEKHILLKYGRTETTYDIAWFSECMALTKDNLAYEKYSNILSDYAKDNYFFAIAMHDSSRCINPSLGFHIVEIKNRPNGMEIIKEFFSFMHIYGSIDIQNSFKKNNNRDYLDYVYRTENKQSIITQFSYNTKNALQMVENIFLNHVYSHFDIQKIFESLNYNFLCSIYNKWVNITASNAVTNQISFQIQNYIDVCVDSMIKSILKDYTLMVNSDKMYDKLRFLGNIWTMTGKNIVSNTATYLWVLTHFPFFEVMPIFRVCLQRGLASHLKRSLYKLLKSKENRFDFLMFVTMGSVPYLITEDAMYEKLMSKYSSECKRLLHLWKFGSLDNYRI